MRLQQLSLPLLASVAWGNPICNELTLTVEATALNVQLPSNYTQLFQGELTTLLKVELSGSYKIAARYCEPEVMDAKRKDTLQVLVHGVTYSKDYWSGLGPPGQGYDGDTYSYVRYVSKQGFPTLAIDRICNGDSDKPNGLLVCQLPVNMETLYQIINQVYSKPVVGGRKFNKIVPVCHSEGSTICQYLMQIHPDAPVATYVITAFTNKFLVGGVGSILGVGLLPAGIAAGDRFPTLDPTYLIPTNAKGARGIFYYGDYDPDVAAYDFDNTHPIPLGEVATSALSQLPASEYEGSLLLLNGENDQIFCAVLPLDPLIGNRGRCGTGPKSTTARTGGLFPKANFTYQQVANTGHNLFLHRTAPQIHKIMNDYLIAQGL